MSKYYNAVIPCTCHDGLGAVIRAEGEHKPTCGLGAADIVALPDMSNRDKLWHILYWGLLPINARLEYICRVMERQFARYDAPAPESIKLMQTIRQFVAGVADHKDVQDASRANGETIRSDNAYTSAAARVAADAASAILQCDATGPSNNAALIAYFAHNPAQTTGYWSEEAEREWQIATIKAILGK